MVMVDYGLVSLMIVYSEYTIAHMPLLRNIVIGVVACDCAVCIGRNSDWWLWSLMHSFWCQVPWVQMCQVILVFRSGRCTSFYHAAMCHLPEPLILKGPGGLTPRFLGHVDVLPGSLFGWMDKSVPWNVKMEVRQAKKHLQTNLNKITSQKNTYITPPQKKKKKTHHRFKHFTSNHLSSPSSSARGSPAAAPGPASAPARRGGARAGWGWDVSWAPSGKLKKEVLNKNGKNSFFKQVFVFFQAKMKKQRL